MTKQEQIEEMAVIGCVRNPQAHTAEECSKCDFKQGMCNAYRHAEALYNAGYRKILENVVELPCKVGDTVYIATKLWDIKEVVEAKVACIEVTADEKGIRYRTYLDHEYVFSKTNPNLIANRYIFYNDEFFLTKAEAEEKLKELQETENL